MIRDFPDDVDLQKACGMYGKNAIYKLKYRKWVFNMSTWGQNITFCPLSIRFDKFNLINSYNYWTNNTKSAPKFVTFSIQFLSLETAGLKVIAVKSDYKMYNQQHQEGMVLDKNNDLNSYWAIINFYWTQALSLYLMHCLAEIQSCSKSSQDTWCLLYIEF